MLRLRSALASHRCNSKRLLATKQGLPRFITSVTNPSDSFYNRSWEVEQLTADMKGEPKFTVLLGPPSSGKTALMRHVVSQKQPDIALHGEQYATPLFHPLTIDLRAVDTSENGSFLEAFMDEGVKTAVRDVFWKQLLPGIKISNGILSWDGSEVAPSAKTAAQVFKYLGDRIPQWTISHGKRPPVLIIDEANSFKRMKDETIQAFLDFAVKVTKQEGKMHVVFTSSDSFFENWLKDRINSTHFRTLVVGDLPRKEAHDYFLYAVQQHPHLSTEKKSHLMNMDLGIVFRMTGGRMFFLKTYVQQVHVSGYIEDPMDFEPVQLAYTIMEGDFLGRAKTYAKTEALAVCKLLVNSPGYISYLELVEKLGASVVREMIARNFLHYRPVSKFARDLIPFPTEPVVTAQSEPSLRAMEAFVKKFDK